MIEANTYRLRCYAWARGFDVEYNIPSGADKRAAACCRGKVIYLSKNIAHKFKPYVLAHEIGHLLDLEYQLKKIGPEKLKAQIFRYRECNRILASGKRPHTSLLLTARHMELRADSIGKNIMKYLNLDFSAKLYKKAVNAHMKVYR